MKKRCLLCAIFIGLLLVGCGSNSSSKNPSDVNANTVTDSDSKVDSTDDSTDDSADDSTDDSEDDSINTDAPKPVKATEQDFDKLEHEINALGWFTFSDYIYAIKHGELFRELGDYAFGYYDTLETIDKDPKGYVNNTGLYENDTFVIPYSDFKFIVYDKLNLSNIKEEELSVYDSYETDHSIEWFLYVYDGMVYYDPIPQGCPLVGQFLNYSILDENNLSVYVKCDYAEPGSDVYSFSYYLEGKVYEASNGERYWSYSYWNENPKKDDDNVIIQNTNEEWKAIYRDLLGSFVGQFDNPRYTLAYIDNDNIPEIIISEDDCHAGSAYIYTCYNGKLSLVGQFGGYGSVSYIEKGNRILASDGGMGYWYAKVCEIVDGKSQVLLSMNGEEGPEPDLIFSYYLDGNPISEEEMNQLYSQYFETSEVIEVTYDDCTPITSINF